MNCSIQSTLDRNFELVCVDTVETQLRIIIVVLVIYLGQFDLASKLCSSGWFLIAWSRNQPFAIRSSKDWRRDQIVAINRLIAKKV